ncbi:MAG: phosphoribosylformylglycinamidine synthase subunit PurQ [Candidatus Thermoplasmatota archaeon]|nr:phosphoribosylformylglycinamidine synthase subunit PurQ [Candidatus Thermoplasmatota archaeon]
MKKEDIKIAILRIEGTNCEEESFNALSELGVQPEYVHLNEIGSGQKKNIFDYQGIFIPGGFSSGDYVRAGAIFAARIKALMVDELKEFVGNGYPVVGVCNGFQVLIELGLLPAIDGVSEIPEACLAVNDSNRFECRPTLLRHDNVSPLTSKIKEGDVLLIPSAHMEGKLMLPKDKEKQYLRDMEENGQIVFRYVNKDGETASYPWNPNGSLSNIAGICNPEGNVLGMMPHPERAFYSWQHPGWKRNEEGDGRAIFESIVDYIGTL